MKLASLRKGGRDGRLVVVRDDMCTAVEVADIALTLQQALDDWKNCQPQLLDVAAAINSTGVASSFALNVDDCLSPLPRAYQFVDGSAYLAHVERVRRARGAEMPPSFLHDPLMYQAVSDGFLSPNEDVQVADPAWGIDFESEIAVITDDVPMGIGPGAAAKHIQLVMLINDVSLRNLIPQELAKGFGFLHSKPRTACTPVAVTPDSLGDAWRDCKVHLPLISTLNGRLFGQPEAGEDMQFDFAELISHAAKSRPLAAGSIVGSGTVANQDVSKGASCLAERRMLEIIDNGEAKTPFMQYGDQIKIEMNDNTGKSIFGVIEQTIKPYEKGS